MTSMQPAPSHKEAHDVIHQRMPETSGPNQEAIASPLPVNLFRQAARGGGALSPGGVLQLQRAIGNRAVSRLLSGSRPRPVIQASAGAPGAAAASVAAPQPNQTGLPDALKAGVETLSGYSLDDVRVHYNSEKPAKVQALAYTQGTDIHVAPGQEEHLPHEAWHVVQQVMSAPVTAPVQQGASNPLIQRWGKPNDPVTFPDKQKPHVRIKLKSGEVQVPIDVDSDPEGGAVFKYLAISTNKEEVACDLLAALENSALFFGGQYSWRWKEKTKEFISKPADLSSPKRYHTFDDDDPDSKEPNTEVTSGDTMSDEIGAIEDFQQQGGPVDEPPKGNGNNKGFARPSSAKTRSGRRLQDALAAKGTPDEKFREWLLYEFKGDPAQLDEEILRKAKAEGHETLVTEGGYLGLSDGDKMEVFYNLGRLTMQGSGAEINVEQEKSFWERLTGGDHWDWEKFSQQVRKVGGSAAMKKAAEQSGADIPGISSIEALPTKSAFQTAIALVKEQLTSENIKQQIKEQTIGPEDDSFEQAAVLGRNIVAITKVAIKILTYAGSGAVTQGVAQVLPGLNLLIEAAKIGSTVDKIKYLNSNLETLEVLRANADKIPDEIYARAIQKKTLERNQVAAASATIAISVASGVVGAVAAAGVITGPATMGAGFGLAALAVLVGGIIALAVYLKNKDDKNKAARQLLAKIHGLGPEAITEANQNEYLMKIGYAKDTLLVFWNDYLTSYSKMLYDLVKARDQEAIDFVKSIAPKGSDLTEITAKKIKDWLD